MLLFNLLYGTELVLPLLERTTEIEKEYTGSAKADFEEPNHFGRMDCRVFLYPRTLLKPLHVLPADVECSLSE